MSNIYEFKGIKPVIDESCYIHPTASIIGNVIIKKNVYIGPGASLRGDFGGIVVGEGSNVQDNCIIHMFPGVTVMLGENSHIGHGSIIHGANIGNNVLIGMNAVIMDNAVIGDYSIIGALCFVPGEMIIPERKVVVGNPAKILRDASDDMIEWKSRGTQLYNELTEVCHLELKSCEPLREAPADHIIQEANFKTWKETIIEKKSEKE